MGIIRRPHHTNTHGVGKLICVCPREVIACWPPLDNIHLCLPWPANSCLLSTVSYNHNTHEYTHTWLTGGALSDVTVPHILLLLACLSCWWHRSRAMEICISPSGETVTCSIKWHSCLRAFKYRMVQQPAAALNDAVIRHVSMLVDSWWSHTAAPSWHENFIPYWWCGGKHYWLLNYCSLLILVFFLVEMLFITFLHIYKHQSALTLKDYNVVGAVFIVLWGLWDKYRGVN